MRTCALTAICFGLSGCAWTPKPYTNDPLIRTKIILPGDSSTVPATKPVDPPQPPEPPDERVAHRAT